MTAPAPASLGRATMIQAAGTALSRITGFGRVFALAYALGAGLLADTYHLANNTPNIIFELILGGVLSGMVLPEFVRQLRGDDREAGWRAVSAVVTVSLVGCALLAIAFVFVAPWFIRLYTLRKGDEIGDDQLAVATDLLRLFAPQVFFYGSVYLSTAILRAQRRFAAPMFAPVLNNVIVIALFLAWPSVVGTRSLASVRSDTGALLLLGVGTTAGVAAMAIAQLPLRTALRHLRWVWQPRHPSVVRIVRLGAWTAAYVAANQLALFVVYFLANGRAGDVAIYVLAHTIFLLPHGVVSVSIISALQPDLAERWAASDTNRFRYQFGVGVRSIAAVMLPAAAGYILLARPLVSALLEHGALGRAAGSDVASTLVFFAIGLPGYSVWLFIAATYQAMQNTRSLFGLYVVENAVNVVAALALYPAFGVQGLSAAFAVAYTVGAGAGLWRLRGRVGGLQGGALAASMGRAAVATAVMAMVVAVLARVVGDDQGIGALVRCGVSAVAGVTVFLLAGRALGVREITELVRVRGGDDQ